MDDLQASRLQHGGEHLAQEFGGFDQQDARRTGIAAAQTGNSVWLAYLVAGLMILPAMYCMSELSTAMPRSGGTYFFLDRSMGPLMGTVGGLGSWVAVVFKSAFALVGMGAYLALYIDLPITVTAIALTIAPSSLVGARDALAVRPGRTRGSGRSSLPAWLSGPSVRPRVLVLRGGGPVRGDLQSSAVRALQGVRADGTDCELVLVRPPARQVRHHGPGVRTVGRVPLDELLPACAAVLHDGSAAHVLAALAARVATITPAGPPRRRPNNTMRAWASMPLRVTPA